MLVPILGTSTAYLAVKVRQAQATNSALSTERDALLDRLRLTAAGQGRQALNAVIEGVTVIEGETGEGYYGGSLTLSVKVHNPTPFPMNLSVYACLFTNPPPGLPGEDLSWAVVCLSLDPGKQDDVELGPLETGNPCIVRDLVVKLVPHSHDPPADGFLPAGGVWTGRVPVGYPGESAD